MNRQVALPTASASAYAPAASAASARDSALDVDDQAGRILQQERGEVAISAVQSDHGLGLTLELVPGLHERDLGALTGLPYERFGQAPDSAETVASVTRPCRPGRSSTSRPAATVPTVNVPVSSIAAWTIRPSSTSAARASPIPAS